MVKCKKYLYWPVIALLVIFLALIFSETGQQEHKTPDTFNKDTLRFVIGDNRGDYFIYRAEPVGYQLEMIRKFANAHRCKYQIRLIPSLEERCTKLLDNTSDIMICSRKEYAVHRQNDSLTAAFLLPDSSAWLVNSSNATMANTLSQWIAQFRATKDYETNQQRYLQGFVNINVKSYYVSLSPYDDLIKKYALQLDWDWRLLAALICQESRFNPTVQSSRGAYGLMQVLPQTAEKFGFTNVEGPESNIAAGVKLLHYLKKYLQVADTLKIHQQKFMLAAYNAGNGRISDCRSFAKSQGKDPDNWDEVASAIPLMRHQVYYNGELIQLGLFKGTETLNFVREVWDRYENYQNLVVK